MLGRIRKGLLSVLALGACAAALAPACAHNDQSVFIRTVMAPPANRQNGCLYQPDPNQPGLFSGTMDLALTSTYNVVTLIGNQLATKQDLPNARAESARIAIYGATVRVADRAGATVGEFTSPTSSSVTDPNAGTPGFGIYQFIGIDPPTAQNIRGRLPAGATDTYLLFITVFGQTLGGADVESNEFQFPVAVCNGCLVDFPASSNDPALARQPNCLKQDAANAPTAGNEGPCFLGQDEAVSCTRCVASNPRACDPFCRLNPQDPACGP